MSDDSNLWVMPSRDFDFNQTTNIPKLMQKQCEAVEEASGGQVHGRFGRVNSFEDTAVYIRRITSKGHMAGVPSDSKEKDAGDLYIPRHYAFEIFSEGYTYRIFEMRLPPVFPVSMRFDDGLLDASDLPLAASGVDPAQWLDVESDEEVMDLLSTAIRSRKMQFILYRLLYPGEEPGKPSSDEAAGDE